MSAAAANGAANESGNGAANEAAKKHMLQKMKQQLKELIDTLANLIKRLLHSRDFIHQQIATLKESGPTHRIQTLRRGRPINKGRRRMKRILHLHMIFMHDVNHLLMRYNILFTDANKLLAVLGNGSVTTPPLWMIEKIDDIYRFYERYSPFYSKISEEHDALLHMIRGKNSENSENSDQDSNNNAELIPNIRFGPSSFHAIPHRLDAANEYLPAAMPAAMQEDASSMGGARRQTRSRRTRTLRKKRTKRTKRTLRNRA